MEKIQFKYYPHAWEQNVFTTCQNGEVVICECCGKESVQYLDRMYCVASIQAICPQCVANGEAAKKFDGDFIQDAEVEKVSDEQRIDELFHRTPGYHSWQGEYWLACCDDFCAYIKPVKMKELKEMGIADEVCSEYEAAGHGYFNIREQLTKDGSLYGYLFQCLHCGKYHLGVDAD